MDTRYVAQRLHAGETADDPNEWISHEDWCETPDPLREPLTRDEALKLIEWDRRPGDTYRIRPSRDDD